VGYVLQDEQREEEESPEGTSPAKIRSRGRSKGSDRKKMPDVCDKQPHAIVAQQRETNDETKVPEMYCKKTTKVRAGGSQKI
jgi:hypothetical protein